MADVCRFCLSETTDPSNPFLSPCLCAGSSKYVHRDCLIQWRQSTTVDAFKTICQLCNAPYNLPRRWAYEQTPLEDRLWKAFLSQSFLVILLVHYFHLIIASNANALTKDPYETAQLLHSWPSLFGYNCLLFAMSLVYVSYYTFLLRQVININHYIYFGAFDITRYLFGCAACIYLSQQSIFPFGGLYLYLLSYYRTIHIQTLNAVNSYGTF